MGTLKSNWLTENHIDFEYKKNMLLAYLQDVKSHYERNELYPILTDLITHYKNLKQVKDNANAIKKGFSKEITGIDWQNMELIKKQENLSDNLFQELEQIIDFAMPLFVDKINTGKQIYDNVEQNLSLSMVGITPLRKEEGYLIISTEYQKEVYVYQFSFSTIHSTNENMKQLLTEYISTYTHSISNTFEKIKQHLISTRKELPNPAVYAIKSKLNAPFSQTLLPVAKRFFVTRFSSC